MLLVLVGDAVPPGRRRWQPLLGVAVLLVAAGTALATGLRAGDRPGAHAVPPGARRRLPVDRRAGHRHAAGRHPAGHRGRARAAPRRRPRPARHDRSTTALLLAAATGGAGVAASRDLGTWLVTLELATVPVVALVALRGTRTAAHGALTLLVTSVTSFALLVLGAALWLTATGDAVLRRRLGGDRLGRPRAPGRSSLLAATVLLSGLGFKLSLVPFHAWTPQAYSTADLGTAAALAAGLEDLGRWRRCSWSRRRSSGRPSTPASVGVVIGILAAASHAARQRHGAAPGRLRPGCWPGRPWRRPAGWCCPSPR